jgi:hypothetical protein
VLRLCPGLPAFISGVPAQRVIPGNLNEDQRYTVRVGHVHLVQTPGLLTSLAGNRHTSALQFSLRGVDIAHLQPQCARERAAGVVRRAVTRQLEQ